MTIRHRISLLVILTFLAISAVGGYAIIQTRSGAAEVRLVTEGVVPSALASADLVSQLKDVQLATVALVSAPDKTLAEQAKASLATRKARLQEGLAQQSRQATGDAQRGLVDQAKESLTNYFASIDDTTTLKLAGQTAVAEANLSATVGQYLREMEQIVETLRVEKSRTKDAAIESLNSSLAGAATTITAITLVAVAILSAMGFFLYQQIAIPLGRMQAMMTEIATSQDFTRRLPVGQEDELGRSIKAFNAMIEQIQESSIQLRQKTADMQTMLQNLPQGILTIAPGNKVHPEYSTYLETILETKDIAGRNVMDLVMANTTLGADTLAQVEAAAGACIGEDVMNFEFNEHLMVGEIEKQMPGGHSKVLDLNWSPIVDETNTTVRLLLCIRDVTELRALAAEAKEQKRELEMIGEILAISQEKFFEFIEGTIKLLDESEAIIHAHPAQNADAIAALFRNLHTVKGNARTYALRNLTNIVHQAEQTYDELRKRYPDIVWDQALLLEELNEVRAVVARYTRINEVSLGRRGPGRRGNTERYLLVDRKQIEESLHRLETVNTGNVHELLAARDAVHRVLRLLGTERISDTLSGVLDSASGLAIELGKLPPIIAIADNGYMIRNQASGMLKNVFMHLVRNSIDHGLETPDERKEQGKPASGNIHIEVDSHNDVLQIRVRDDGRGLPVTKIREAAIARGFLATDSSDEQIAAQIFRPGVSTAEKLTEVSGRGVGMDAVQIFVKREHGKVEIRFLDDNLGASHRRFETVLSLPASLAVRADDSEITGTVDPHVDHLPEAGAEGLALRAVG